MTEKDFWELVNHEIDWLYYYAWNKSRSLLNENSDLYSDLQPIGYVKRPLPLDIRCAKCVLTSDKPIEVGMNIEDLYPVSFPRRENIMTPLEIAIKIFPERKMELLDRLRPKPNNSVIKKKKIIDDSVGEILLSIPEIEQQCMVVEKAVREGYFDLNEALENYKVNQLDYTEYLISKLNKSQIK